MNGQRFNIGHFNATGGMLINEHPQEIITISPPSKDLMELRVVKATFEGICAQFKEVMNNKFREMTEKAKKAIQKAGRQEDDEFVQHEHEAIIGVPETVTTVMEEIQTFLNSQGNPEVDLPDYYKDLHLFAVAEQQKYTNLTHAVFHETYGFKALAGWLKYPKSYAAQVIGTAIWIYLDTEGKHKLKYRFRNKNDVKKIIRSLTRQKEDAITNRYKTTLEVDLFTGERVTMTIEPDVKQDVITFRRYLIGQTSVVDLATPDKQTIPEESVPMIKALAKTHCNIAIVGPPGTGKSTTLKALLNERDDEITGGIIEKHYELAASRDFPDKKLIERITQESTFEYAFDQMLRFDVDYVIVGELRRVEIEGIMLACERLMKGMMTTYHTWKPHTMPEQWARLNCNLHPGMVFDKEMKRVAENIDYILVQMQDKDKKRKRIVSIQEMRYDPLTGQISTHEIMKWDRGKDRWLYRADIHPRLYEEMMSIDTFWAETFMETLTRLSKENPIPDGVGVTIYNPIEADPNFRIAEHLSKLVAMAEMHWRGSE